MESKEAQEQQPRPAVSMEELLSAMHNLVQVNAGMAASIAELSSTLTSQHQERRAKRPLSVASSSSSGVPPPAKVPRMASPPPTPPLPIQDAGEEEVESHPPEDSLSDVSSEEEFGEEPSPRQPQRLFDTAGLPRFFNRILTTLDLQAPGSEAEPQPSTSKLGVDLVLPGPKKDSSGLPFPAFFQRSLEAEWAAPANPRESRPSPHVLYKILGEQSDWLQSPKVDAPIACLGAPSTLASDSEVYPSAPTDRRIDKAARQSFHASSGAFKAAMATSMACRAMTLWCQQLGEASNLPKPERSILRHISEAASFAADASADALKASARAMGSAVVVRRNTWLRNWEGESAAHAKLAALPFKGSKLFGDGLAPFLVDSKGPTKALPPRAKPRFSGGGRQQRSFRPFRQSPSSQSAPPPRKSRQSWRPQRSGGKSQQQRKPFNKGKAR